MQTLKYFITSKNEQMEIEIETKEIAKEIVGELVAERKRQGLTQQDIADMTGMKAPNVTRVESCKFNPSLEVLFRYATVLGKQLHFELMDDVSKESK